MSAKFQKPRWCREATSLQRARSSHPPPRCRLIPWRDRARDIGTRLAPKRRRTQRKGLGRSFARALELASSARQFALSALQFLHKPEQALQQLSCFPPEPRPALQQSLCFPLEFCRAQPWCRPSPSRLSQGEPPDLPTFFRGFLLWSHLPSSQPPSWSP